MDNFRDYVLEEGDRLDAIVHGFKTGWKAFKGMRKQQVDRTEQQKLTDKIMSAESKDLQKLVKQVVSNGYTFKNGQVTKPLVVQRANDWLLERREPCTTITKTA